MGRVVAAKKQSNAEAADRGEMVEATKLEAARAELADLGDRLAAEVAPRSNPTPNPNPNPNPNPKPNPNPDPDPNPNP